MAYLRSQSELLAEDELVKGVVDTFIQQRMATLTGQMPFVSVQAGKNEWLIEDQQPGGTSVQNPYSTSVNDGQGKAAKVSIDTGQLSQDAKTALMDIADNSNPNNIRMEFRKRAAKRLAYDFEDQMFNAMNLGPNLHGLEWYLTRYGGFARPGGSYNKLSGSNTVRDGRKIFWADNSNVSNTSPNYLYPPDPTQGDTPNALTLEALDNLLSRDPRGTDVLLTDRQTKLWIFHLLRVEAGGSRPETFQSEAYSQQTFTYQGVPVINVDHTLEGQPSTGLGSKKFIGQSKGADFRMSVSSGNNVDLTVKDPGSNADDDFVGFSDLDVNKTITLDPDGSGSGPEDVTISDVKDRRTVELESVNNSYTDEDATVQEGHAIYGVRFGEMDGVSALYNDTSGIEQTAIDSGYDNASNIVGFRAVDKGESQNNGRYLLDAFDWLGTFRSASTWAIVRLSHYKKPSTY